MAEEPNKICKFNQTGFCKFGIHCGKKHENQVCDNTYDCTKNNCDKRHPQTCRNFSKNGKCRFQGSCAYLHEKNENSQELLNEQFKSLMMKHENDIQNLTDEVNRLKSLVQNMTLEMVKNIMNEVERKEKEIPKDGTETEASLQKPAFKCEKCEYTSDKEITLNKHMNTRHIIENKKSDDNKEYEDKHNFNCDECSFSSKNKKNLKKHKDKHHSIKTASQKFTNEDNLNNLNIIATCECSEGVVCDSCLSEWVK